VSFSGIVKQTRVAEFGGFRREGHAMEDRKRVLSQLDLFAGLGDRELSEISLITKRRRLRAGEALFHKGDEGGDIYVIVSGRLKAYATGPDGDDVVFRYMGAGEVVGELGAFVEGKRTASTVAVEDCELLMIQKRDLIPLLRHQPEISIRLLGVLAARTIKLSESLEDNNFRPVSARLAKCLLSFADRWPEPGKNGAVRIRLRLPQGELGDLVGATRESVNKLIRQWTVEGILEMHDGAVTIKNRAALEKWTEI
jgi:CRP/FNR family cyclic AMP-dependent transcriptional regulator